MSIRNLDALFQPRSVALIGASNRPGSVGEVAARNLFRSGFSVGHRDSRRTRFARRPQPQSSADRADARREREPRRRKPSDDVREVGIEGDDGL